MIANVAVPRYTLLAESDADARGGQWRFTLTNDEGRLELVAGDCEPQLSSERLELLSVVRGLEALEQPSQVTLVTRSRYVRQGMRHALSEWRESGFLWERFGELVPVKHDDLWRRVDRALQYHRVECRTWRVEGAHSGVPAPRIRAREKLSAKNRSFSAANRRRAPGCKPRRGGAWYDKLAALLRWRVARWAES